MSRGGGEGGGETAGLLFRNEDFSLTPLTLDGISTRDMTLTETIEGRTFKEIASQNFFMIKNMPLFLTFPFFKIHSYNTIIHSFILRHLPSPVFLYLHRFIFIVSMGCRAENRTRACITASRLSDSPTTLGFGLNAEALIFEASVVNMDCGQPSCKCSHLTNVWNISQT